MGVLASLNIDKVLSNSVNYLELFGNIVIAWIWLRQGIVADRALANQPHADDEAFYLGKLQALRYFYRFELPEIHHWATLLNALDSTCYDMRAEWF